MDTTAIVVLVIFGILVVAGLALGIRQGAQTKARIQGFATMRGFTASPDAEHRLAALLALAFADQTWYTSNVLQVQQPPESVYLFGYSYYLKDRPSKRWQGFACLAEYTRPWSTSAVDIFTRTPGIDALESNRVQAGGEEFQSKFTVVCKQPEAALAAVNREVEQILLEHAAGPGWYLIVTVAANSILAASSWAKNEDRKSTRLNSSHIQKSRMPSSA